MTSTAPRRPASPNLVLAMLLLVYVFNFVDRQILAILAAPIQADLGLDDAQMGMLGGLAFAILYSTLGVPLAWLADRTSRSWVITGSLVIWSLFTAVCGAAQGFWHIFLARLGVGVGEAGGVAPSYAVIGDHFPSERRAFALSVYSLGIPLGSATGVLAGGYVAARVDWRAAFLVVGIAGLLIAPLFKFVVRDRPKPAAPASPAAGEGVRFLAIAALLARKRGFWLLSFGAASSSMLGYGLAFWLPSLLQRSFHLELVETSWFIGAVLLLGGSVGVLSGGLLADRLGRANRAFYAWVPAMAFVAAVPLFAGGIWTSSVPLAFLMFLVPQALAYIWLGPVTSAIQHLVEPPARATASALFLLINNLIGLGGGIYALGALSTALAPVYDEESLRYSMLFGLVLYLIAAVLMALAGPALRREWVSEG
ncbi:spinster family MFS transporter [Novosphingobium pentaromativorans]|uniref:Major facilitator transporter n=1 Tax=Novosphingobium pentaromativorans US6-1 TaxID=1088721 RepID=G6ED27_9SPHN|nr:MFS transporter [Novosphingobium pentaromativorans]AIT79869.1 MFS transporter [Novosphingobium pentaromativorans US6-1]EHJ60866.1 major facilitator transporter [Novosphingobium pentaromativorans US6-1]